MNQLNYLICIAICISGATIHTLRADPVTIISGMYEIKAETFLPNLREHLRHTKTNTKQCLDTPDVFSLFPILSEVSFTGCDLITSDSDTTQFSLICENVEAASGDAQFNYNDSGFSAIECEAKQ